MKYLVTVAFGLCCACASAQNISSGGSATSIESRSSSNVSSSITSNGATTSSVTSAVDSGGTGVITNSIVGRTGSMCSGVFEGVRCEITCRAPQVAQCGKAPDAAAPSCLCK